MEAQPVQVVKNSLDTKLRDRKKSATYYEKHKADILARRKERYQAEKDRLQAIQREYARKKRAERKAERETLKFAENDDMYDNTEAEGFVEEVDIKEMLMQQL